MADALSLEIDFFPEAGARRPVVTVGQMLRAHIGCRAEDGSLLAVAGLVATLRRPDGNLVALPEGSLSQQADGRYQLDITPDVPGDWWLKVAGSGPDYAVRERGFGAQGQVVALGDTSPVLLTQDLGPVVTEAGGVLNAVRIPSLPAASGAAGVDLVGAQGGVAVRMLPSQIGQALNLTTDDIAVAATLGDGSLVLRPVGDGVSNAVPALESALAAAAYDNAYVPAGVYVTTFAQAFQFPGRWALASPGLAKIGARTLPFGDIRADTTLYAGAGGTFTSLNDALAYLHDRRIRPRATLTIQVADGVYTPAPLLFTHPDGIRVKLLGNVATPANCQLTVDGSNNGSAIAGALGCSVGFVDGFTLIGANNNAGEGSKIWNAQAYGAGILAQGGGAISVGGNMLVQNFYYGYLADKGGVMLISPGARAMNTGDVAYHARQGGAMQADGCSASFGGDLTGGKVLGSGVATEAGSNLSAVEFTADHFEVAGATASGNSHLWVQGLWSTANVRYGAVCFGGWMHLGVGTRTGRVSKLNGNGYGLVVANGGYAELDHAPGAPMQINSNIADGIYVLGGRSAAYGYNVGMSGNAGFGIRAVNGGFAQVVGTIAGALGATVTDSGRYSQALTS